MSWSLRVSNGDLVLGSGGLDTVSRQNKLVQDFRHYLLERLGSDPLYPTYGSTIDGGTALDGSFVESPIASTDWRFAQLQIESEIRRVAAAYQRTQLDRAKADRMRYNKSTLMASEILAAITKVEFAQQADALYVTIYIQTAADTAVVIDATLPPVLTT